MQHDSRASGPRSRHIVGVGLAPTLGDIVPIRRVVITGLGVVAANGIGKKDFWQACISGHSGIRRITRFDASPLSTQIAGEVVNFDPAALGITADVQPFTESDTES